ncbi:class I SAM-dependent methyltransferase [Jiangella muralis]|uniref:class I SAM-dependent methyltransferase n=1 Tax=Jiangella muralis TaxID=702383 RepID=UPI00069FE031|nr:class I SAM-dependent methyltransferase [Jiangella muralis]
MTDVTTAQDSITRYWTDRADSYDAHHREQLANAEVKAGWTDVWRRALPAPPARVLGTDLSPGMLAKARAA